MKSFNDTVINNKIQTFIQSTLKHFELLLNCNKIKYLLFIG